MKKWIALVIIVLILIMNPSKSNTFNKKSISENGIQELNSIEVNEGTKYTKYQENLILGQGKELISINADGESNKILKLSKEIENFEVNSNSYIDILDKKDNKVTSIDNKGKTVFTDKSYQEIIMYKSISPDIFVTGYKDDSKQYVRIQDIDKDLIKEIEYSSKITHIDGTKENLLVIDLKTDKGLYSELNMYDTNGNLLQTCDFDDVVVDIVYGENSIYIAFEDKVLILDEELKEKSSIKINGLESIENDGSGNIFVVDREKKIACIDGKSEKNIKSKSDVISIEAVGDDYITYSDLSIYSSDNKEIAKFDGNINDIICINNETIGVYIDGSMKIIKLS